MDYFPCRDRSAHNHFGDERFSLFNPFRNFYLALTSQQRNLTHLPQVHPHRVTGSSQGSGLKFNILFVTVVIQIIPRFGRGRLTVRVDNLNIHLSKHIHNILQLIRGHHVSGQNIVHLIIGQETFFLPHVDQLLNFFRITFLRHFCAFSSASEMMSIPYLLICLSVTAT